MSALSKIKEHMEVIGADGVHVGTVDKVEGNRIKLTKKDSGEGSHKGHHHFIDGGLVAEVEGDKVRLSANGDVAFAMEEEKEDGKTPRCEPGGFRSDHLDGAR
jgi:hypothetical protein